MSNLKIAILVSVLSCLSACGRQVVEFGADAGPDAGAPDGSSDLDSGPGADAGQDAGPDSGQDAGSDSGLDSGSDSGLDSGLRTPPRVVSTIPSDGAASVALGDSVFATFSQSMAPGTIDELSFTLRRGTVGVGGAVTWNQLNQAAAFDPTDPLLPDTVYTATVTTRAENTDGVALETDYTWTFTSGPVPVAPTVVSTTPANEALEVVVGAPMTATFSEAMAAATLENGATFSVTQAGTPVAGGVTYDVTTRTATFDPSADLEPNRVYTAVITTAAQSSAGLALAADYSWEFTTTARPTVLSTLPANGAISVPPNNSVFATFSKAMDSATINTTTFTVTRGAVTVPGVVSWNPLNQTATFNPNAALSPSSLHTATLTTGVRDTTGLALAATYTWTFTTGATLTAPTIVSTIPANNAVNVAVAVQPTATFSGAMNAATINAATFTLRQGVTAVAGGVAYNATTNTATFSPSAALLPNTVYTATVTTGAQNTAGLALAADYTWQFTTTARPTVTSTLPASGATAVPPNDSLFATFSKAMDSATINTTTFSLMRGATAVPGVVSWNAGTQTAAFNPNAALSPGAVHTATITTGARDTTGLALAANYTWSFTTAAAPAAPTVVLTSPPDNATGVAVAGNITATFSQAMDAATITAATFTLSQGATAVPGAVTFNAATNTATFNPTATLGANLPYVATVTTGVRNTGGLALAANYSWDFTTIASPAVLSTVPMPDATDTPVANSVSATFTRAMSVTTLTTSTFTLTRGATPVAGVVTYNALNNTATFNPTDPLLSGTLHTARITTGARDTAGMALAADYVWSFTTEAAAPTVLSVTPLNNAIDVSITTRVTARFSQPMNTATLTDLTFTLTHGLVPVTVLGDVTYNALTNTATFTPDEPLELDTRYTATITTGAEDTGGRPLASDYTWVFDTGACGLEPIELGAAEPFVVLAYSTVTSTGPTRITGDLGVSPGTAITGFPPGIVVGMQHAGTSTSAPAIADLTTAYNDAAGRVLCPITVAGNLGGTTKAPGLYKSTSSLEISSGDLTLDAQGDGDALFIFQMASTLTTSPGRQVILAGGAKAANIYWQVGSSATIGTTSVFHGTIMADAAITLGTGATLTGRALARTAAVSLDSNVIVIPAP